MSFITAFGDRVFIGAGDLIRTFRIGNESVPEVSFKYYCNCSKLERILLIYLQLFISWSALNPDRIQKPDFEAEKDLKAVDKKVVSF